MARLDTEASLYEPSFSELSDPGEVVSSPKISWHIQLVLVGTAFVSWTTLIFAIALSMRNMFSGPPPDCWGDVFAIVSFVAAISGLLYVAISQPKLEEATVTIAQRFALLLLVLANVFTAGQIMIGILSFLAYTH